MRLSHVFTNARTTKSTFRHSTLGLPKLSTYYVTVDINAQHCGYTLGTNQHQPNKNWRKLDEKGLIEQRVDMRCGMS